MKKRVKNCRLKYSIHITKAQNKTSGTMKTHHIITFHSDFLTISFWFTTLLKLLASSFGKKKADFSKQRSRHISPVVDAYNLKPLQIILKLALTKTYMVQVKFRRICMEPSCSTR